MADELPEKKEDARRRTPRMTDLEMTRLCAEAMGWRFWWSKHNHWNADGPNGERWGGPRWYAFDRDDGKPVPKPEAADGFYDFLPLNDDAQAMALGKKFPELMEQSAIEAANHYRRGEQFDLNADLCRRVAKMQEAKNV